MNSAALSTMWGIKKFDTLAEFFKQGSALGFTRFELNHGINSEMLRGLNGYRITSVHEPCPADVSLDELRHRGWLISSSDEGKRCKGVDAIRRSIDLAQKVGASVVIVHPGKVDVAGAGDAQLEDLFRRGQASTPEYARLKERIIADRAAQAQVNLSSVRQSVIELAEYAEDRKIKLGLENRYHYSEIPLPDELADLLNMGLHNLGFWYDVGHAETLAQLGFHAHEEWLKRFSSSIVGTHLHDVVGIDNHRFAGAGQIDWQMVARYLPDGALRTCEFQNFNSPDQVRAGVQWLAQKGCLKSE